MVYERGLLELDGPSTRGADRVARMHIEGVPTIRDHIDAVLDEGSFMEMQPLYGRNLTTGLGRLDGFTVGVVRVARSRDRVHGPPT